MAHGNEGPQGRVWRGCVFSSLALFVPSLFMIGMRDSESVAQEVCLVLWRDKLLLQGWLWYNEVAATAKHAWLREAWQGQPTFLTRLEHELMQFNAIYWWGFFHFFFCPFLLFCLICLSSFCPRPLARNFDSYHCCNEIPQPPGARCFIFFMSFDCFCIFAFLCWTLLDFVPFCLLFYLLRLQILWFSFLLAVLAWFASHFPNLYYSIISHHHVDSRFSRCVIQEPKLKHVSTVRCFWSLEVPFNEFCASQR